MNKTYLKTAALLGAISVALGAFGAHGLKKIVSTDAVQVFDTAVKYQFYHSFAILFIGILFQHFNNKLLHISAKFFIAGIICFSGSLYLLTIKQATSISWLKFAGPITPIGGVCFIVGWLLLFYAISKKQE